MGNHSNDNDDTSGNCAARFGGGWWFTNCYDSFLTGPHTRKQTHDQLLWYDGSSQFTYFPHVEMKIRRKSCPKPQKEC